ncbi:pentatricopeptide repeat-containing protein At1g80880, mitochondrial [Ziziphus jujuba]|uniref:Pentatricopeptide repeat-containing protein At1g80880, mitochondrial n=1 Tax=Ziziphus jujuba TaxID=326968 RepID=A0ABM3IMP5_ZIZJJ|nr:pentatricopeptide repeat-containing protein At1g80880, mitochondrial [Ziziphus jujuba]
MAISTLGRSIWKIQSQLFLPQLLRPITHSSSCSFVNPLHRLFSQAFRQTILVPFRSSSLQTPHFSSLQLFSAQNLNYPFDFHGLGFRIYDLHDPGVLESVEILKRAADLPTETEAMLSIQESGIEATRDLVCSAIWGLREEWKLAFLAFKWGEKCGCSDEETCNLLIWVLGNHRKFNTAWCLIRDLHRSSMDTRRAMLIMIDRYAFADDPSKAIWTFDIMEKFSLAHDHEAYRFLLNALCAHGYIEEAEEFMLVNKKPFPLETESFNIILNGWCNMSVDVFEAKRVWREMSKCCILPDATSYTYMVSCFSKVGNLFDSLRLYDEMKKRGWVPGLEVYNSLIYVLTHENCLGEALKMLDKVKELGLRPDSTTYNSMIRPLCEAQKLEVARKILTTMIEENICPTSETYHAFLGTVGFEGTLEVVNRMKKANLGPSSETFLIILRKFFKLEQPENAVKIWEEMRQYEVVPDSTHYTVMIQGLATFGLLNKANTFLSEMRSDGFVEDPKLKKLLKEPKSNRIDKRKRQLRQLKGEKRVSHKKGNTMKGENHHQTEKKTSLQ